ncbi:Hypothetical predicted protein, partial [Paramuricea clavata]
MQSFPTALSSICRRQYILEHFGEVSEVDCKNTCDNCTNPIPALRDYTNEAKLICKCIQEMQAMTPIISIKQVAYTFKGSKSKREVERPKALIQENDVLSGYITILKTISICITTSLEHLLNEPDENFAISCSRFAKNAFAIQYFENGPGIGWSHDFKISKSQIDVALNKAGIQDTLKPKQVNFAAGCVAHKNHSKYYCGNIKTMDYAKYLHIQRIFFQIFNVVACVIDEGHCIEMCHCVCPTYKMVRHMKSSTTGVKLPGVKQKGCERAKTILKTKYGKTRTQPKKIHGVFESLVTNTQALETMGKVNSVKVRLDDEWQDWGFTQLVEALRKWCERNPIIIEEKACSEKVTLGGSKVESAGFLQFVIRSEAPASECRSLATCLKCKASTTHQHVIKVIYPVVVVMVDGVKYNSNGKKGGGLLIYIPEHLIFKRRLDLEINGIECIWIEINFPNSKPILVSFIYRPPSSGAAYLDTFDSMISKADADGNPTIILGDFNFDLLSDTCNTRFKNVLATFNLVQLITVPTRPVSRSLLDHVYVSHKDNVSTSGTLPISISDHLPVFVNWTTRINFSNSNEHKYTHYRSLKNFSAEQFVADLKNIPWNTLDMFTDVNEAVEHWYSLFNDCLNNHAPLKTKRVKRVNQPEWFSCEISEAIKKRNYLHHCAISTNTPLSWQYYRTARNRVVHLIRDAKRTFYTNSINANLDNPKNLWKIIRNLAPSNHSNSPNHLTIDGKTLTNPKDIADSFNDHFTNIRNSVSLNSFTNNSNWDYLSNFLSSKIPPNTTFTIPPIFESFVRNSFNHLPETKAAGLDRIGGYFLKIAATAISPALTKIYNLSINSASFPDLWKIAK